ncbi:MAG: hypothetical protein HY243_01020 [Proteobacteria bacterium]|nr:hypothetical protein [Pseudomonadota bacterium]
MNERPHLADNKIQQFVHDDAAYLRWLEANPEGYVINSFVQPTSNYLILHRASCRHINTPNRTNWTTTGFIKTCSSDVSALEAWTASVAGGSPSPCEACKPRGAIRRASTPTTPHRPVEPKQNSPVSLVPQVPSTQLVGKHRAIPQTISTGCPELDLVWARFSGEILNRTHVLIPDAEDDLNWHAFLGHSIDMQGFRAAEFVGVDPLTKPAPNFVPLNIRGIGVTELGALWNVSPIRDHLLGGAKGTLLKTTLDVLKASGGPTGLSLAEAFEAFPHRKGHWTVKAYLQNSVVLEQHGYSFRRWLQHECDRLGAREFPPPDFRKFAGNETLEMALRRRLEQTFCQVGPALAAYMICDWQLWLWNEGRTGVFANFKLDSFHEEFVTKYGRGVVPTGEHLFTDWWLSSFPDLPPRLANECIWLGMEHGTV